MAVIIAGVAAVASELLSIVWFEAAMFSCAAIVYFAFTNKVGTLKAQARLPAHDPQSSGLKERDVMTQSVSKALRQGKLDDAVSKLRQLPIQQLSGVFTTVAPRLLTTAAKAAEPHQAMALLGKLAENIEPNMFETAVIEAQKRNDVETCIQLDRFSKSLYIPKTVRTFEVLAKAYSGDVAALRELMKTAESPLTKAFAKAVLEAAALAKDVDLVVEVFERADTADASALRAFAEAAASNAVALGTKAAREAPGGGAASAGHNAKGLATQTSEIRALGRAGDLAGATTLFERLPMTGGRAGTTALNSIIDACVECGDLKAAHGYVAKALQRGLADAATFNTMMKGLLAAGKEAEAEQFLEEISKAGVQATQASYHGLLHARVLAGDRRGAWSIVGRMRAAGVGPNAVTCSILLKLVAAPGHASDVSKIMQLVGAVEDPIDEVLLSSILDACLKTGHLDLLSEVLARNSTVALTSPMYGSMIKAFGMKRDLPRVWGIWHQMHTRRVQPTAITLGCMMEALVVNCCAEEAWQLLHDIWEDPCQRHLVNTVTYTTLLKGFAKYPDKVVALYGEMRARGVECNTITYNTLLNTFAQSRAMHRVPQVLEDMRAADPPVEPDVVTYSTLIKGFCSCGSLDRALGLLEEIEKDGKHVPDEMMFNSLLDGCAKEQRINEALRLVDKMRQAGIAPSNYTLSMLVKLLGRCRKLALAFSMVEDLTSEFGFRPNIQVYTCLIQACFHNRQSSKALALLERIFEDGLRPDEKTYTVLVRGLLQLGQTDKAAQVAQRAYEDSSRAGVEAQCLEELMARLGVGSAISQALRVEAEAATGSKRFGSQLGVARRGAGAGCRARAAPPPWHRPGSGSGGSGGSGSSGSGGSSSSGHSSRSGSSGHGSGSEGSGSSEASP